MDEQNRQTGTCKNTSMSGCINSSQHLLVLTFHKLFIYLFIYLFNNFISYSSLRKVLINTIIYSDYTNKIDG